jgi:NAD(P)H-dependent FMN reductase
MKKIIAFAGSNSKNSINKQFAIYASSLVDNVEVTILDLNDFELPIYGIDYETENGIPENAHKFLEHIKSSDGIILSLAEHNGAYAAVFKNLFDWMSRINTKLWNDKSILIMATSPGGRGGATVLGIAKNTFPHLGANIIAEFSLPSFYDNFLDGKLTNEELNRVLKEAVKSFQNKL